MTPDLRVLIVDDDFRVGGLHRDAVADQAGFEALEPVRGVREARAAVRDRHPDLVLCDVYLPDGDGIAFVSEIDVDALVISAASDADTVRRALRAERSATCGSRSTLASCAIAWMDTAAIAIC